MADGNGSSTPTELAVPSNVARLNYFYGQLLAQADLKAEQSYHVLLRRLVQRETFGTGTVAGLRVRPADPVSIAPRGVFVEAGLAIDPAGRELLLESAQCVDVADAEIPPKGNGIPSDATVEEMADELNELTGRSIDFFDVIALANRLHGAGMDEVDEMSPPFASTDENASLVAKLNQIVFPTSLPVPLAPAQTLADWLFEALVGTTYVGVRYLERGSAVAPALLDGSCCDSSCHPTRVTEGLTIVRSSTPFPPPESPYDAARAALSERFIEEENPEGGPAPSPPVRHSCDPFLSAYLLDAWRGLPPGDVPCAPTSLLVVPLARVYWARYPRGGSEPRILDPIDNATFRPLAPSPVVVRALFDVVTQCASPVAIAPFFESIEPATGAGLDYSIAGTEVRVTAKATGPLALNVVAPLTKGWSIDFHPDDGSAPSHWGEVPSPSSYPASITSIEIYVDGSDSRVAGLKITKPANVALPDGTYVWRFNLPTVTPTPGPGDWALRASETLIGLDGDPRPPMAVPSGDGKPGGVFEARFYVSN